jgi:hypothetical protein
MATARRSLLAASSALTGDGVRVLEGTPCRAIRNIHARKFERPPAVVAAAGVELRGMVREGEPVFF